MFGAIIPEPLAIAPIFTCTPPSVSSTANCFGNVSVVMIASAAASLFSSCSFVAANRIPASTFSIGMAAPIIPVEALNICPRPTPIDSAANCAINSLSRSPASPLQAFALPLLTTTMPNRESSHMDNNAEFAVTQLARTMFCVNTPAATASRSETISAISFRFRLIPQ